MTSELITFESKDQNMWATGDALKLEWHEYFPLIGGDRVDWQIANVKVDGNGIVVADGRDISFDPKDRYDDLADGATKTIIISYDIEAKGETTKSETLTITATGTSFGTTFTVPDDAKADGGKYTFTVIKAEDIMGNPHNFDTVTPIDINWDLVGDLRKMIEAASSTVEEKAAHKNSMLHAAEVQLDHLNEEIVHMKDVISLTVKKEGLAIAIESAELAEHVVEGLETVLETVRLDKIAAEAAHAAAVAAKSAAHAAVSSADVALDLASGALDVAQNALSAIGGFISSWFGSSGEDEKNERDHKKGIFDGARGFLAERKHDLHEAERELDHAVDYLDRLVAREAQLLEQLAEAELHAAEDDLESLQELLISYEEQIATELFTLQSTFAERKITKLNDELAALETEAEHLREELAHEPDHARFSFFGTFFDFGHSETEDKLDSNLRRQSSVDAEIAELNRQIAENDFSFFPSVEEITGFITELESDISKAVEHKSLLQVLANEAGYAKDQVLDLLATGLDGSELKLTGKVDIDAHAQAGLQVDFVLDGGSVNSKIDYTLDTEIIHRDRTDSVDLKLMLTNQTTGDMVAFDTHSPSMQFYAGIVYDVGAKLSATFDMLAEIAGITLIDVPGDEPVQWSDEIRLSGWLDIFDYDSRTDASFEPPIPGLLGDILSVEFNFPSIETLGIEAKLKEEFYKDPAAFSLDGLADKLLNLFDFDPHISKEFKAFLAKHELESEVSGDGFVATLKSVLKNALDLLTAASDPTVDLDGDGVVPIFLLTKEGDDDELSDALFHINTYDDVVNDDGFDINKMGKFGFYMATGKSEPLVKVDVDVDQLIATIVSAIAEGGVPAEVLNPFDIGFDASDIFGGDEKDDEPKDDKTDPKDDEEVEEPDGPLTLDVGFEILDLHVSAEAGIEQKFGLSIDDMVFNVKLEGNKKTITYKALDKNFNVHGSDFHDKNGDGIIDYSISITPDAQLFNDTQIAFKLGYVLDLLKAHAKLGLDLPVSDIPGLSLLGIDPSFELELGLGPIVRLEGELEALTADLFEDIFEYHAGSATTTGTFEVFGITLNGSKTADKHVGHHNDDVLKGGGGSDKLLGKNGHDTLHGGNGHDKVIGGGGNDHATGGAGNDTLKGGGGHDTLIGDAGEDVLKGGGGKDTLSGGFHKDKLIGGGGNDTIEGGGGNDVLKGGGGSDVFVFDLSDGARTGIDKILGFNAAADTLQFTGIEKVDVKESADGTVIDFDGGEILLKNKKYLESELTIDFV
ncbi:calcium-binding protein [Neptunicoccus cionae]|uniref:Uncharacterized protein n=1 Tax=Neptunicoccus cionae TaxID=2035344 RepID=A0A916VNH7_9RHOB|nr:calcium-binding protein [Amylibacter cionae]GGA11548.1 hypothetical protein GCM10011498_09740 [Amylibacter cionae]